MLQERRNFIRSSFHAKFSITTMDSPRAVLFLFACVLFLSIVSYMDDLDTIEVFQLVLRRCSKTPPLQKARVRLGSVSGRTAISNFYFVIF